MSKTQISLLLLLAALSVMDAGAQTPPPVDAEVTDAERALLEKSLKAEQVVVPGRAVSEKKVGGAVITPSMMNPQISFILDFSAAYFSERDNLQTGAHDPSQNGFNFQQLEVHIESRVDPYFDFQTNIIFSLFGLEVEEAYARTLALPWSLQLKAGQLFLPFGRANPTHPHTWQFLDQPLMLGKFMGGEGGRGLGIEFSWLMPLPWFAQLTGAITQPAGECCSKSFVGGYAEPIEGFDDFIYLSRLEQFWPLNSDWSLLAGTSYLFGENKTGLDNWSTLLGGDLLLRYRPVSSPNRRSVSLQVEWTNRQRQRPLAVLKDKGGYAEFVVQWNPSWTTGARYEWVDGVAEDGEDPDWISVRQRYAGAVTWFPSHFSRLRLQVSRDDPSWRTSPIWSAMLGLEVLVGAHGAHSY